MRRVPSVALFDTESAQPGGGSKDLLRCAQNDLSSLGDSESALKRSAPASRDLATMAQKAFPMFVPKSSLIDKDGQAFQEAFQDELIKAYVLGDDEGDPNENSEWDSVHEAVGLDIDDGMLPNDEAAGVSWLRKIKNNMDSLGRDSRKRPCEPIPFKDDSMSVEGFSRPMSIDETHNFNPVDEQNKKRLRHTGEEASSAVSTSQRTSQPIESEAEAVPALKLRHPSVSKAAKAAARDKSLRKEIFFRSLEDKIEKLWRENQKLKQIAMTHLPTDVSTSLLHNCISEEPSILTDKEHAATSANYHRPDSVMLKVLQEAQQSFVITDPNKLDNPIVWVSPSFCALTGYCREEIIGRNCRFLQGPCTDPDQVARIRKAVEEGVPESICLVNYRKDGSPFWNKLFISPLYDRQRKVTHIIGVQSDVSATKRIQKVMLTERNNYIPVCWQGKSGTYD